ncbi:MAG: hypothetical protein KKA84_15095 [Bacteroidetes bacterium]|nr:hypothetical protein [Bacteroidota bacterium]
MENEKIIIPEAYGFNLATEDLDEEKVLRNGLSANKLRMLGKENFRWTHSPFYDYYKMVKDSTRLFNFNLPAEFNKAFVSYQNAFIFWVYKSPLMGYVENYFQSTILKGARFDRYKHLKEFFIKWTVLRSREDKAFYASSAINYIEKDLNKKNFINQITQAVILTYEDSLHDPDKAMALFDTAQDTINSLKLEDIYKQELTYHIKMFKGFLKLKEEQPLSAATYFQDALSVFPGAISPKFHLALCEVLSDNLGEAAAYLDEVFQNDIDRLNFAISTNKFSVFVEFLEHNITKNVFDYVEFAPLFDMIEGYVSENKSRGNVVVSVLRDKLQRFKDLKLNEFYSDEIVNNLAFLEKIAHNFSYVSDTLFCAASHHIEEKFEKTVALVGAKIRDFHYNAVDEQLKVFNHGLSEQQKSIDRLQDELEEFKIRLQKKLKDSIQTYEKNIDANIKFLEHKVENIHQISGLDPKTSMRNNLNYNFILALMVFLIGGFASYSSNTIGDISEFKDMISIVILTGLKWGSISFFIGIIISFFIAGSVLLERGTQKQRVIQKVGLLKNEKQRIVERLKDEAREREASQGGNLEKRIAIHRGRINELKNEQGGRRDELQAQIKDVILKDFEKLNTLISTPMKLQ